MATAVITITEVHDEVQISVKTEDAGGLSVEHAAHVMAMAMVHWALQVDAESTGENENG